MNASYRWGVVSEERADRRHEEGQSVSSRAEQAKRRSARFCCTTWTRSWWRLRTKRPEGSGTDGTILTRDDACGTLPRPPLVLLPFLSCGLEPCPRLRLRYDWLRARRQRRPGRSLSRACAGRLQPSSRHARMPSGHPAEAAAAAVEVACLVAFPASRSGSRHKRARP
jgi:hypothetical protein